MIRQLVLVALPVGKAVEDLPLPQGSIYAATSVSLEALERGDVGLADSCGRKLMRRVVKDLATAPAWRTGVGAPVWVSWCGERFPGIVSHQMAEDVWAVRPAPDADRALLAYYACKGGWNLPAASITDRPVKPPPTHICNECGQRIEYGAHAHGCEPGWPQPMPPPYPADDEGRP